MATVTFTKVSGRVTINSDGVIIGLRGQLNVLEHPQLDAIVITQHINVSNALNGDSDSLVFNVSDVTSPSAASKDLLVIALQSIFS